MILFFLNPMVFFITIILILLGGAIFKLVKKGASILLLIFPIMFIVGSLGFILSIIGFGIDYFVFTIILIVYFYNRHKIPKEIRKTESNRIIRSFIKVEVIVFHLLGIFLIPVPVISLACATFEVLLFLLVLISDKNAKKF